MSKIIVIDGMDGSGKHTQTKLLKDRLSCILPKNKNILDISFPRYGKESATLVEMYLQGCITDDPMDINAYAASLFYAMDRYISYKTEWGEWVNDDNAIIICDRYISSNVLHQAPKLPPDKRAKFVAWLYNTEVNLLGLPAPDIEIFLDVPTSKNIELVENRYDGDESLKDIHETETFQQICHQCFDSGKDTYFKNMKIVNCIDGDGNMRSKQDINDDIVTLLKMSNIIC